jgi:hypothetical protein
LENVNVTKLWKRGVAIKFGDKETVDNGSNQSGNKGHTWLMICEKTP